MFFIIYYFISQLLHINLSLLCKDPLKIHDRNFMLFLEFGLFDWFVNTMTEFSTFSFLHLTETFSRDWLLRILFLDSYSGIPRYICMEQLYSWAYLVLLFWIFIMVFDRFIIYFDGRVRFFYFKDFLQKRNIFIYFLIDILVDIIRFIAFPRIKVFTYVDVLLTAIYLIILFYSQYYMQNCIVPFTCQAKKQNCQNFLKRAENTQELPATVCILVAVYFSKIGQLLMAAVYKQQL